MNATLPPLQNSSGKTCSREQPRSARPDNAPATAATHAPLVSIGLPVYNGARYLPQALESLLGQTYRHFELIVSDNASTDETAKICARFAAIDRRVRYIRHPVNVGAPRNWSYVVTIARGRYFKWASCNDWCAPQMLERCMTTLEQRPDAVLCYGRTALVDEETGHEQLYLGDIAIEDALPSERLQRLLRDLGLNNAQSGVIRLDALRQTGLDRPYPAGDVPLMAELALRGAFVLLPDVLLFRRMGSKTFSRTLTADAHKKFFGSEPSPPMEMLRRHRDNLLGVLRAPIGAREKGRSIRYLARSLYWDMRAAWGNVLRDAR
jgi:glycosyltransferase involved in cell wall biosynthesis